MKSPVVCQSYPLLGMLQRTSRTEGVRLIALLVIALSTPSAHGDPQAKAKAGVGGEKRSDTDAELLRMMSASMEKSAGPASKQKSKSLSNLNLLGSDKKEKLDSGRRTKSLLEIMAASQGSVLGLRSYESGVNTKPVLPDPPPKRREPRVIDVEADHEAFERSPLIASRTPIPQPEGPKPILTIEHIEVAKEQRAAVTKVVGSTMDKLRRCYEEALRRKSDLSGTVEWQGVLASAGMLRGGKTAGTLADPQAAVCTAHTLESLAYPVSTSDQSLRITIQMRVSQ